MRVYLARGQGAAKKPVKRVWTIIGVADVPRSYRWYASLLGLPETRPAHDYFGQIVDTDGTVLLCLHSWGTHEHPSLTSPNDGRPGNGLLLFFRVDNPDLALSCARTLVDRLEEEPACESQHRNVRVFASGSRRILCHHQRDKTGLNAVA